MVAYAALGIFLNLLLLGYASGESSSEEQHVSALARVVSFVAHLPGAEEFRGGAVRFSPLTTVNQFFGHPHFFRRGAAFSRRAGQESISRRRGISWPLRR